jgi:hypothetical protein
MPTIPATILEPTLADLMRSATAALDAIIDSDRHDETLVGHPDWENRAALAADLEANRRDPASDTVTEILAARRYYEGTPLEFVAVDLDDGRTVNLTPAEFREVTR